MIPRIKTVEALEDFQLLVTFDDGVAVKYDVKDDIRQIPEFSSLKCEYGLFRNVQLDSSRTCLFWNDRIDLPSDAILEYGQRLSGDPLTHIAALPLSKKIF